MSEIDFDDIDIVNKVETLDVKSVDSLPFGVVRLDNAGVVRIFNTTEAEFSGYGARPNIGKNFFTDIAPCMNTPELRGQIDSARSSGSVDKELGWIGDFDNRDGEIRLRALSASDGGVWLFLNRESD